MNSIDSTNPMPPLTFLALFAWCLLALSACGVKVQPPEADPGAVAETPCSVVDPAKGAAKETAAEETGTERRLPVILWPAGEEEVEKGWRERVTGMAFVWVPGGCYRMGDIFGDGNQNEIPVHEVCVDGFWMGKYEVTQGQWEKVTGKNPSFFKKGDNYPVERVSWHDVQDFIRILNSYGSGTFRLPTEAEWEYAARSGGKAEKYAGGDDVNQVAWYSLNSGRSTRPVGRKAPNGLGIYDMSGNVWEWCEDVYDSGAYRKHERHNPMYVSEGTFRVIRGGSWRVFQRELRSTSRIGAIPEDGNYNLGFRLVRPL
jgi:formylglycine-generating enzyme required for sulfatase activity